MTPADQQLIRRHSILVRQGVRLALVGILVASWWWLWGACANPLNTSCWIAEQGDRVQHFAGWLSVLPNPSPSVVTTRLSWPIASSLVYTDSIPLLGLLLQPLGQRFPGGFQYFSLAHLAGILLTAWAAASMARTQGLSRLGSGVLVLALALAPIGLVRALGHTGLATHGVIVWALAWLMQRHYGPWRWGGLVVLSMGLHAYLTGMVLLLWGLAMVCAWRQGQRKLCLWGLLSMHVGVMAGYRLFGYDVAADPAPTDAIWNANLLALVDPQGKASWFGAIPIPMPWQWEGFAYLGLPVLLALLVLAPNRFQPPGEAPLFAYPRLFWGVLGAMALYALGPEIWLGPWKLFSLRSTPLIDLLDPIYGFFRSTGRFLWPLYDALLIWVVCRLDQRLRRPWLTLLLGGALFLESQVPTLVFMRAKASRFEAIGRGYPTSHAGPLRLIRRLQRQGITHLINATGDPQQAVPGLPAFALSLFAPEIATNHAPYLARTPAGFDRLYQGRRAEAIVASVERQLAETVPKGTAKVVYLLRLSQAKGWSGPGQLVRVAQLDAQSGLFALKGAPALKSSPRPLPGTRGAG